MREELAMGSKPDYLKKKFRPLADKSLLSSLMAMLKTQFPRLGGDLALRLYADLILSTLAAHQRPMEHVCHGQALWLAFAIDDPPRRHKRTADSKLVPVVLDLSTPADCQARIDRVSADDRLLAKCRRLCQQAYDQGGLLSGCDLAELLTVSDSRVGHLLARYEREHDCLIPRRATVHDMGSGLTHKRLIIRKRFQEGKEPHIVAKETYHSLEAVDNYLTTFARVRSCLAEGLDVSRTAYTLGCSESLVREYLAIHHELTPS
jgi:hypothetical protein